MDRINGTVLLVVVCALLVVVSSAVESGKVSGADYRGGLPFGWVNLGWTGGSNVNANATGRPGGNVSGGPAVSNPISLPALPSLLGLPTLPALPTWLWVAAAAVCFGGACMLVLRLRTSVQVLDLEGTLRAMEEQRKYLEESRSYKLRNAALLRYYLLMRRACLKVGLRDEPAETPQEYVERASSFFKVEELEAGKFASAVNRSRYGEELSQTESMEVSKFMSSFADVIRRRAGGNQ